MAEESKKDWGFVVLGGSESFDAAIEDLTEEENWMFEAEDIPVSAEEVIQKIRLALGKNEEQSGGGACGRGDRSGGCQGCTCGKR